VVVGGDSPSAGEGSGIEDVYGATVGLDKLDHRGATTGDGRISGRLSARKKNLENNVWITSARYPTVI
jgi:hypothetical protein